MNTRIFKNEYRNDILMVESKFLYNLSDNDWSYTKFYVSPGYKSLHSCNMVKIYLKALLKDCE